MNPAFRSIDLGQTRITTSLDFDSKGSRTGDFRLKYSDNNVALGYIPIPAAVVVGEPGPTVLLIGGVHGDEFEGPIALLKFLNSVNANDVHGRIIVLPTLNSPAVHSSSRVSPMDNGNLNRAFPGSKNGGPTEMIAHLVEEAIMPACDTVVDLHSGGKAAWFSPCAMAMQTEDVNLSKANLKLAEAFGADLIWLMGELNDDRSVNSAANRKKIPMIAAELGSGGQVTPETLAIGEQGVLNILNHLGVLESSSEPREFQPKYLRIESTDQHIYSPHRGLFEPLFQPGRKILSGDDIGRIHRLDEIEKAPSIVTSLVEGVALARCHRGLVERGELLALIGKLVDRP